MRDAVDGSMGHAGISHYMKRSQIRRGSAVIEHQLSLTQTSQGDSKCG